MWSFTITWINGKFSNVWNRSFGLYPSLMILYCLYNIRVIHDILYWCWDSNVAKNIQAHVMFIFWINVQLIIQNMSSPGHGIIKIEKRKPLQLQLKQIYKKLHTFHSLSNREALILFTFINNTIHTYNQQNWFWSQSFNIHTHVSLGLPHRYTANIARQ